MDEIYLIQSGLNVSNHDEEGGEEGRKFGFGGGSSSKFFLFRVFLSL